MQTTHRVLELPVVIDTDPDALDQLVEYAPDLLNGVLPAVAIRNGDGRTRRFEPVHNRHKRLVLGSLAMLGDSVLTDEQFSSTLKSAAPGKGIGMHLDQAARIAPRAKDMRLPGAPKYFAKVLNLHTAGVRGDAQVFAANVSRCRQQAEPGKSEYASLCEDLYLNNFMAMAIEGPVYAHPQRSGDSIWFTVAASYGPETAHWFDPESCVTDRQRFTSDVTVYSVVSDL